MTSSRFIGTLPSRATAQANGGPVRTLALAGTYDDRSWQPTRGRHVRAYTVSIPRHWQARVDRGVTASVSPGPAPRGPRSGPALRNPVATHLRVERRATQAEQERGGLLVPPGGLERAHDRDALDLLERSRERSLGVGSDRRRLESLRQVVDRDL